MRTTYCGLVSETLMGQTVTLMGWAHRRRDHGGVIFIDLRDREGLVQVVCDPDRAEMFRTAEGVRNEFCLKIVGLVRPRPAGTENANLTSGKIEILCHELEVLNASVTPPFQLDDDNLSETVRLTHRVLDLRRPAMQKNMMLRYRVAIEVRKFLDEQGFVDIETPMLTKSTPEGARDYLVPSRVHDGTFFALPQSPQLFKQLLMVAGFDRYYQITKCFRDEDLRADRQDMFRTAEGVRNEFCLKIVGLVRPRPAGTENANLTSGKIEILCHELEVLNASVTPPFQLDDDNLSETVRLTHRVLDLRRPAMQKNMMLRYRVAIEVRKFLDDQGFVDIETPMLTKSTPEGARDYLVPSRVHDGTFFALPQSPQLFKQLLMVAGFDRYYQITKCFRDEDLRADRQPEFTQIDIETSFLNEAEIRAITEAMIRHVFRRAMGVELPVYPVMTYADAMAKYGSDKPDLRVKLEFTELTSVMKDVDFKVFSGPANNPGGRVVALRVPGGGDAQEGLSRGEIDAYTEFVKIYGAKGLAWIKVNDAGKGRDGLQSPIVKNLHDSALEQIIAKTGARNGDLIFFGADKAKVVNDAIGALRVKIGHSDFGRSKGLFEDRWAPLWVVDFPMFEHDEDADRWVAVHHPFTAPKDGHENLMDTDPGACVAKAYDMVLNGWEIGGGSVRILRAEVQRKVFEALKISAEDAKVKFGFLLDALQYGAPPHGGLAFGLDRIATLMAGADSIRDVIAFPKTQRAQCLLTGAPSHVDEAQLRELHIRLRNPQPA